MSFFARNIQEILQSKTLKFYGFFLSLTHILTYLYWRGGTAVSLSSEASIPLCWPFYQSCGEHRFSLHGVHMILDVYLGAAILISLLFLSEKTVKIAYWASILIWTLKWIILAQDYRLMGNYHYMPFILAVAFLFIPKKLDTLRLLIVGFYVSAGSLKLSPEWISGSALYGSPIIHGRLLELCCIYVIFLEFFVSFGLLTRKKWIFLGALSQFIIFHIFSWHIVGFFYPTVMACVLSIFVLAYFFENETPLLDRLVHLQLPKSILATLLIYTLFQLAPLLYPGDTSLTGEGRIFSLNMFDSKAQCEGTIISRFKTDIFENHDESGLLPHTGPRIHCDPLVYYDVAKTLCKHYEKTPGFQGIDLSLTTKRTTDGSYLRMIDLPDFCKKDIDYSMWKHNPWIIARGGL